MARGIVKGGLNDGGSNIKSIQRGVSTVNLTSFDVAIAAVNITKSIVMLSIKPNGTAMTTIFVAASLTTSTNINFSIIDAAAPPVIEWQVIEFNNVKSLQTGTKTTALTTDTITISSVNMAKSIVHFSFKSSTASTSVVSAPFSLRLSNSTTLAFDQNFTNNKIVNWQVIEFN